MAIGTAGFTALLCSFAVQARETILLGEKVNDVLVTGATGGVGSIAVQFYRDWETDRKSTRLNSSH